MERLKLTISYDGTFFSGYQVQQNQRTVQSEIEAALQKMHKTPVKIYSSGRTDSQVHALGQVIHFDTPLQLGEQHWLNALTTLLPDDIQIVTVEKVDSSFHARIDAVKKTYRYIVLNDQKKDIFNRHYEWHVPRDLNVEKMQRAAELIVGTHDFSAFCASKTNVIGNKTRTIYRLDVWKEQHRVYFEITGDGFLTHMVRIIVGTLVEIGLGKKTESCIPDAFLTLKRQHLGMTAPGHGLYLKEVSY